MNKEEKEAIEHLKVEREYAWDGDIIEIALNLIEKLQKENQELSESNFHFLEINQKLIEEKPIIKELTEKELTLLEKIDKLQKDSISKDIIRDKIKKLEEEQKKEIEETNMSLLSVPIRILKELLGE